MSALDTPQRENHRVLTVNSGSSSLKIALFRVGNDVVKTMSGAVTGIGAFAGLILASRFVRFGSELHVSPGEEPPRLTADINKCYVQNIRCNEHMVF